jgi:hypothetical protein
MNHKDETLFFIPGEVYVFLKNVITVAKILIVDVEAIDLT